ncbi:MAG: phosphoribosylaminoimidazolesuccinocarboxamide synthase, partial [Candidatus Methanomethylophilaceae archaeon]|nr:phosphoribosylaminoimidazolesuccinocarboxamide synthase [Candidatus Methanomethylophilaceae archaeon]
MEHIRTGKVKEVYAVDENTLEFVFTDNISVFDKIIPSQIPHKGETLCRTAKYWFTLLKSMGIDSHFKEYLPPNRMRVKRFNIIEDYDKIHHDTTNYLIPLEVICRHYAAGSLMDRIKKGKITPEQLGFPNGHEVKYGEKLPKPFLECTTKLEAHDRELDEKEAKDIAALSDDEYDFIMNTILKVDEIIDAEAAKRGLIHCDGKKEFGYDEDRNLMLIDTFGTLDEDRWWDAAAYAEGKVEELSKEFVRQHYRETGYHAKLIEAREKGLPEPDIPALPQDV